MPAFGEHSVFLGIVGLSAAVFATALRRRSWPLWLIAFVLLVLSLGVAWSLR